METYEAVRTLLAVRAYRDEPLPASALGRIVEAGHLSGSASNRQPWHFLAITERDTLRQLGGLIAYGPYIATAPACVVVLIENVPSGPIDGARAIQSMVLTGWAEGIGSNWVTAQAHEQPAIRQLLGIPDALTILAVLPFGYPATAVGKGRKKRKPLAEVASKERFGEAFG